MNSYEKVYRNHTYCKTVLLNEKKNKYKDILKDRHGKKLTKITILWYI